MVERSSRVFVGRIKFKSIAKVGRIRGVVYSCKNEDKNQN